MSKFRALILAFLHLDAPAASTISEGSGSIATFSNMGADFTSGVGHVTHSHATVTVILAPILAPIIPGR